MMCWANTVEPQPQNCGTTRCGAGPHWGIVSWGRGSVGPVVVGHEVVGQDVTGSKSLDKKDVGPDVLGQDDGHPSFHLVTNVHNFGYITWGL